MKRYAILFILMAIMVGAVSCGSSPEEVVIYTSVDQMYSEPILAAFQQETGIRVQAVYDVEATKTTGMVQRLIAEKNQPRADVFWSGEVVMTMLLKEEGILAPYASPNAADIPDTFRDPEHYWTGFAGRARILLINTERVSQDQWPRSIRDLADEKWANGQTAIALPMFGTTATHAAGLYSRWGDDAAREFFADLKDNGVKILDGNGPVKDQVARGNLAFGLTDTDDAMLAVADGDPVTIVFPDQEEDRLGTFIIPNTVVKIAGGPNPDAAQRLIDYLLSHEVERKLVESGWCHFPVRDYPDLDTGLDTAGVREMAVNYEEIYFKLESSTEDLRNLFIQ